MLAALGRHTDDSALVGVCADGVLLGIVMERLRATPRSTDRPPRDRFPV